MANGSFHGFLNFSARSVGFRLPWINVTPFVILGPMKLQSPDRRRPCIELRGWRGEPVTGIVRCAPCHSLRATRLAPPLSTPTKKKHERAHNKSPRSLRPRATMLHRTSRGGRCGRGLRLRLRPRATTLHRRPLQPMPPNLSGRTYHRASTS